MQKITCQLTEQCISQYQTRETFIYCFKISGSMLDLSLLRQISALPVKHDFLDQQKKHFFLLKKKKESEIGVHNEGYPVSQLSKYVKRTFISMKIFLNLLCIQMDSFTKEERATCILQHCVLENKHQQNNNMEESKADFIMVECLHFLITWIYTLQIL